MSALYTPVLVQPPIDAILAQDQGNVFYIAGCNPAVATLNAQRMRTTLQRLGARCGGFAAKTSTKTEVWGEGPKNTSPTGELLYSHIIFVL